MKCRNITISVGISVALAVLATGAANSAQDRYTLKVPNGLAFSEFRGYEGWQVISLSYNGGRMAAILGNPATIDAFKAGIPGNGKPFPDGSPGPSLYCAVIVKTVDAQTRAKTGINDLLRD